MKDLQISLSGKITDTNFDEWKSALIKQISNSNRALTCDSDFALAEQDVKALKAGEKALKEAKQSALQQAAEIQQLFAAIDEVSDEARQARLALERQIKQRKIEIRDDMVSRGLQAIQQYLQQQSDHFTAVNKDQFMTRAQLTEFTKGKRNGQSMQKAINEVVTEVKTQIDHKAQSIADNEQTLAAIDTTHTSLFQDKTVLLDMDPALLAATIDERINYYQQEQERLKQLAGSEIPADTTVSDPVLPLPMVSDTAPPQTGLNPSAASRFIIAIEVLADQTDATEFLDELEGRFGHREMVGNITLSPD